MATRILPRWLLVTDMLVGTSAIGAAFWMFPHYGSRLGIITLFAGALLSTLLEGVYFWRRFHARYASEAVASALASMAPCLTLYAVLSRTDWACTSQGVAYRC